MRLSLALIFLMLVACSSAPPSRSYYLLREQHPSTEPNPSGGLTGIDRVMVPSYLTRAEIVVQTGPFQIHPARYHQWGEPLGDGIRQYLRSALSQRLGYELAADPMLRGSWSYAINLTVHTFHGALTGGVQFDGTYVIERISDGKVMAGRAVVDSEPLTEDGYDALVEAHARLLDRLAAQIAASLESLPTGDG